MPIAPSIFLEDVSYAYGQHTALDAVSLTIPDGNYVGIVGPNGSGKSTLIKLIVGVLKPTQGRVEVRGVSPQQAIRQHAIGYVPQHIFEDALTFPATVHEVVVSGLTGISLAQREKNERLMMVLQQLDIVHLQHRRLDMISGGERQRVFIARALITRPQILILDEPVVGVDVGVREHFYQVLHDLHAQGLTIVIVSHDTDFISQHVQSVICINRMVICHTTPHDFLHGHYLDKMYGDKTHVIMHHHH